MLVVAAALLGGCLFAIGAPPLQIGIAAIVVFALVACWCSDAMCGIVPDVFTLAPLAALLLFAFAQRDWGILSRLRSFLCRSRPPRSSHAGTGWAGATSKLVALAGAALGAPLAFLSLALACVAAVVGHRMGKP